MKRQRERGMERKRQKKRGQEGGTTEGACE